MLSYEQLLEKSDFVVIATPSEIRDTRAETTFPSITQEGRPVPAISMEATFNVLAVLKGDTTKKTFVLHYLRPIDPLMPVVNGPMLIAFDAKEMNRYLLFLTRDADGRYSATNGQLDPYFSLKNLGQTP